MVESRSGTAVSSATAVTVFSCFQGLARLFTGLASDYLVAKGIPRTVYFPMLMTLMACAHGVLCLSGPAALIIGTALAGMAFGSVYPLLVLSLTEIFGKERLASNYMIFDGMPGAIGALAVAKGLAGSVYNAHKQDHAAKKCYGDDCFRLAHAIVMAIEVVGVALGILLTVRTRVVYRALAGGAD
jgi:MFS family permease|eukprot:3850793-Prymnesium_polylepis.3